MISVTNFKLASSCIPETETTLPSITADLSVGEGSISATTAKVTYKLNDNTINWFCSLDTAEGKTTLKCPAPAESLVTGEYQFETLVDTAETPVDTFTFSPDASQPKLTVAKDYSIDQTTEEVQTVVLDDETKLSFKVKFTELNGQQPKIELDGVTISCTINNNEATCTVPQNSNPAEYAIKYSPPCETTASETSTYKVAIKSTEKKDDENKDKEDEKEDDPTALKIGQATYSPKCIYDFSKISISIDITNPIATTPSITLTNDAKKTLEWKCTALKADSKIIDCSGTPETKSPTYGTYTLTDVAGTDGTSLATPEKQESSLVYTAKYVLDDTKNKTVDYKDDDKLNFTVTFKALPDKVTPKILLGTQVISNCTAASNVVTCFPTKDEAKSAEDAYKISYKDACDDTVETSLYVKIDSSFELKVSSLAIFIAMLIL